MPRTRSFVHFSPSRESWCDKGSALINSHVSEWRCCVKKGMNKIRTPVTKHPVVNSTSEKEKIHFIFHLYSSLLLLLLLLRRWANKTTSPLIESKSIDIDIVYWFLAITQQTNRFYKQTENNCIRILRKPQQQLHNTDSCLFIVRIRCVWCKISTAPPSYFLSRQL